MSTSATGAEEFGAGQRVLLERVARGAKLPEILQGIVRLIEARAEGMLCSILLLDRASGCVRHGAALSLPKNYTQARLRAVIEHTPHVSIQWYDQQGRILFCNHASELVFGQAMEHALGKTLGELNFPVAEAERFMSALRQVAATGEPVGPNEFRFRHPDGSEGTLLSTVFQIPYSETESCFVCMDVDLTNSKQMEAAIRAQERLRSLIYDSVTDAIFYLSVEDERRFVFLSVNRAFLRATGLTEDQVVGKSVDEVIPEASREVVLAKYAQAMTTRGPVSWEEVSSYPAGLKYGDATVTPICDASGRCTHLVGTVHDITARKRAEEERQRLEQALHQAERLRSLGTLAGGIAHDFNNILTAIVSNVELAQSELPREHLCSHSLEEIGRASQRAADLVRQILTFGRQQEPQRQSLDLRTVIEEALSLLKAILPPGIETVCQLAEDTPRVLADSTQIHRLVMNLGTNAAHAMAGRRGVLRVSSDCFVVQPGEPLAPTPLRPGRYARVQVNDTGSGMDAATVRRAFDPFFTTKAGGTGLGLSVVHGIMESHQGSVTVDSQLDRGTTISLFFPVAS